MLKESRMECIVRWHLYRRWRKLRHAQRRAEYDFHRIMHRLPKGSVFLDFGANVGDVTSAARKYGMKVVAFEPDPVARAVLEERTRGDDHVVIIPKAVGGSSRIATFHQRPDVDDLAKTQSSSLVLTQEHTGGNSFDVEVINIVDFIDSVDGYIAAIKMDIEGAEVECLEAIFDAGSHRRVGYMFVETHERFSPELQNRTNTLRARVRSEKIENIDLNWI